MRYQSDTDRAESSESLLPGSSVGLSQLSNPHNQARWSEHTETRHRWNTKLCDKVPGLRCSLAWLNGPPSPRRHKINPLFPHLQSWLNEKLITHLSPSSSDVVVTSLGMLIWLAAFLAILTVSHVNTIAGVQPIRLSCNTRLWENTTSCGLDGRLCQPFSGASFPFVCPSGCAIEKILEPHTVGDQEINYRSYVIGGPTRKNQSRSIYRGDSFICPTAIHAGITSNRFGGCGVLKREGEHSDFTTTESHGILSIAFQPSFPLSFSLDHVSETCRDPQWSLLALSATVTAAISLTVSSSILFFSSIFVIVFFQVGLASDAPYASDFATVISVAFERFLPAVFVGCVIYHYCARQTLEGLTAYWDRTLLWVGGCWIGGLNVYTFDRIPISRLTPHDLQQQPGAITALIIILAFVAVTAIGQVWAFRIEGRLLLYIRFYTSLAIVVACLTAIPGVDLRIHHYIIGLLLLPGTALQTRPSLLYQGLLLGLFINGVARWGFASILQTPAALREGAQLGSALPTNLVPEVFGNMVSFKITQLADAFDGFAVLVNDVQRFQVTNLSLPAVFNWTRAVPAETAFFRFAFTGTYPLGGLGYGDFTKPGTLFPNGTWKDMLPGPSR